MMTERIGMDTAASETMLFRNAMPAKPQFSVIVPCRNPGASIKQSLASVWGQHGIDFEIVVIDGASTDGTREWLEQRRPTLGALLSEHDRNVYEAMNKGAHLARGDWLLFLGADDQLAAPDVLVRAARHMTENEESLLFSGAAAYADGRIWPAPSRPKVRFRNFLHHQATFYHRSLFERFRYDETLCIQADYDLNLRLWCGGIRPRPLPVRIAVCSPGGLSDIGRWANYREEITIRHRHFPAWRCWPWDVGSVARWLRKRIVRSVRPA